MAPTAALAASGVAESDGTWISWRAYGEGEPVLMIMGFMGSARAWFRLLPHVAGGHRAIVFDNRGTGDSDRPRGRCSRWTTWSATRWRCSTPRARRAPTSSACRWAG